MGIDSHGNNGHSHSHTGCFSFLPIPIPNFVTNSHYHAHPMGFPFPLGIPFPSSSLLWVLLLGSKRHVLRALFSTHWPHWCPSRVRRTSRRLVGLLTTSCHRVEVIDESPVTLASPHMITLLSDCAHAQLLLKSALGKIRNQIVYNRNLKSFLWIVILILNNFSFDFDFESIMRWFWCF